MKNLPGYRLFVSVCILLLGLAAHAENQKGPLDPPPTTAPKPSVQAPSYTPPPPASSPLMPEFPSARNQNQGGGAEPPPPPPPPEVQEVRGPLHNFVFKMSPIQQPKKAPEPRRLLFFGRGKTGYRSNAYFEPAKMAPVGQVTDFTLFLQTLLHEAENDAIIAKHEYEVDLLNVELNRVLFGNAEVLLTKKAITPMEHEQLKTKLRKSELKAEESKARWNEFLAEQELTKLRLAQTRGAEITVPVIARAYARIWETRVDKVTAAEGQAKLDVDYFTYVLGIQQRLYSSRAVAKEEVLRSQRDADDAVVVLKLASKLVEQNRRNLQETLDSAKAAEAASDPVLRDPSI